MVQEVALITGCSSGIGKATALAFAKAGIVTYATARRVETLNELVALGCHALPLDVTDEDSMASAVKTVLQEQGRITILVNNAGYGEYGPAEELQPEDVRRQFETNVFGLIRMSQLVLPTMRAQGYGRIINVSSVGGQMALPGGAIYHASKYAVEAFSDVMRVEVKPFGVKVILIQPGFVKTRFGNTLLESQAIGETSGPYAPFKKNLNRTLQQFETGGLGGSQPEDIARVILRSVQANRPHPRYKISFLAYLLPMMRRWLPDWGWDAFVTTMIPNR